MDRRKRYIALGAVIVCLVLAAYVIVPPVKGGDKKDGTADGGNVYTEIPPAEAVALSDDRTAVKTFVEDSRADSYADMYGGSESGEDEKDDDVYASTGRGRSADRQDGRVSEVKRAVEKARRGEDPEDGDSPAPQSRSYAAVKTERESREDVKPARKSQPRSSGAYPEIHGTTPEKSEPVKEASPEESVQEVTPGEEQTRAEAPAVTPRRSGGVSSLSRGSGSGVSSLSSDADLLDGDEERLVRCQFTRSEKVRNGQRVSIRTLEDMVADGQLIPRNTDLSATVTVGSRVELDVTGYRLNGEVRSISYAAYDGDGLKGLYSPETGGNARTAERQGLLTAGSTLRSGVGRIAGDVVSAGTMIAGSAMSEPQVYLTSGYTFYIRKVSR